MRSSRFDGRNPFRAQPAAGLLVLLVAPAAATRIDVFPGPGNPIQAAIDAAAPGDRLVLHGGGYQGSVVIDRSVRVTTRPGETVIVSGGDTAAAVEVMADDVTIAAAPRSTLTVNGGTIAAIRMQHATGLTLRGVRADGGNQGFEVLGGDRMKARDCSFSGANVGIHLVDIAARARVRVAGGFAFGSASGALLEDVAPGAAVGRSGISFTGVFVTGGCGGVSVRLAGADGVILRRNTIPGGIGCLRSIELDASSDANLIVRNEIGPGASDQGTGNCWKGNVGADLPATCP